MPSELEQLGEIYLKIRNKILEEALQRGLEPKYRYNNESEREMPVGFSDMNRAINIEKSSQFNFIILDGKLDQLKEFFNNPNEFEEYLREIFLENKLIEERDTEGDLEEAA